MPAYYNEIDEYAAEWLRNLIAAGHLPAGDVDTRSIIDIQPEDLNGYEQCHFFAGIGVWPLALRCAGWDDDRRIWTGSCPCQPFSAAGRGNGFSDERHLWPAWFHLITQRRPAVVVGEQVASRGGLSWFDLVRIDLENAGYACGGADLCAAGAGAPHNRPRLLFAALADAERDEQRRQEPRCRTAGRVGGSSNPFRGTDLGRVHCPNFERWMMGLPEAWHKLTPTVTRSSRRSRKPS